MCRMQVRALSGYACVIWRTRIAISAFVLSSHTAIRILAFRTAALFKICWSVALLDEDDNHSMRPARLKQVAGFISFDHHYPLDPLAENS